MVLCYTHFRVYHVVPITWYIILYNNILLYFMNNWHFEVPQTPSYSYLQICFFQLTMYSRLIQLNFVYYVTVQKNA